MTLSDYLNKNNIILNAKSRTRWDIIQEMLDLAVKNREVREEDREIVRKALVDREKSMSTGIGKGVAIPHCTSVKIDDISIIMAISPAGIDFDAIDSEPVRIVILLLVPKNKLTQHIKTLANIAKIMNNDEMREDLLSLKSGEAIIKSIKKFESLKK
jgi:fructose-specific phosphotransferase system IIA component